MAYTTPNFNLLVDVWDAGNVPADDDPDFENVTMQLYVYSRVSFDVQPCELELYQPPIQLRMPVSVLAIWTSGQVFECPAESGRYYRARFKEKIHQGFPNEYLVAYVVQCDDTGAPIARDIEHAEACELPVIGITVSGEAEIGSDMSEGDGGVTVIAP